MGAWKQNCMFQYALNDTCATVRRALTQSMGAVSVGASSQGARSRNGTFQYSSGNTCTFNGGILALSIAPVLPPRVPVAGMIRFNMVILAHSVEEHSCCLWGGWCLCSLRVAGPFSFFCTDSLTEISLDISQQLGTQHYATETREVRLLARIAPGTPAEHVPKA